MARREDFELLIVRHGMAQDWHEDGDQARRLTEAGESMLRRAVPAWRRFDWHWSVALASPYVRAQQTARHFWDALAPAYAEEQFMELTEPLTDEGLVPGADARTAAHQLLELGSKLAGPRPRVAVFSHNPLVGRLASLFLCGDEEGRVAMGQGDVLHLFVPAPSHLDQILAPESREPLPRAVLLGFYPSAAQVAVSDVTVTSAAPSSPSSSREG